LLCGDGLRATGCVRIRDVEVGGIDLNIDDSSPRGGGRCPNACRISVTLFLPLRLPDLDVFQANLVDDELRGREHSQLGRRNRAAVSVARRRKTRAEGRRGEADARVRVLYQRVSRG